jgi:transposase
MNPVIGLEVAKGESQVRAFLDKKIQYKSSFKVSHTIEGLETLLHFLIEIENKTSDYIKSTGNY